jgi:ribosomal protein S18 acetylase RimI-like enzyme
MAGNRQPFRAERYELGEVELERSPGLRNAAPVALVRFPSGQASRLGAALAAIDPWKSYPYTANGLARYFASGMDAAPVFAIQAGAEIAGVVGLRLDWLRGPYLQFLGIVPGCQGRGLGARVLAWMEREAEPGTRNLWVCASDFNAAAIRFYERHGFKRVAILDGLVQDDRDELLMRKRLGVPAR